MWQCSHALEKNRGENTAILMVVAMLTKQREDRCILVLFLWVATKNAPRMKVRQSPALVTAQDANTLAKQLSKKQLPGKINHSRGRTDTK